MTNASSCRDTNTTEMLLAKNSEQIRQDENGMLAVDLVRSVTEHAIEQDCSITGFKAQKKS